MAVQGGGFFSDQTVTNAAVNAPVAQISDNDLHLDIDTKTANVAQSLGTLIWQ